MKRTSAFYPLLVLFVAIGLAVFPTRALGAAPTTLTFVGAWGAEYRLQVLDRLMRAFEAENPGVKVNVINVGGWGPSEEKASVMIAGGTPPDLLYMGETGGVTSFAAKGLLADLDPFVQRFRGVNLGDFIPSTLEMGRFNKKLYALPVDSITSVLYYNVDLLDKAGLAAPVATLADLAAFSRKLKAVVDKPLFLSEPWNMFRFTQFFYPNGGRYFGDNLTQGLFTAQAARDTAGYLVAGLQEGIFTTQGGIEAWLNGQIGMYDAQPIVVSRSDKLPVKFARVASKFPRGTEGQTIYGWGHYLAIPASSPNQALAWKLAAYLLRPDVSLTWHRDMDYLPAQFSVLRQSSYYRDHPVWSVFTEQLQDSRPLPVTPAYQEINNIFGAEMKPVFQDNAAPASALTNVANRVRALVAQKP